MRILRGYGRRKVLIGNARYRELDRERVWRLEQYVLAPYGRTENFPSKRRSPVRKLTLLGEL